MCGQVRLMCGQVRLMCGQVRPMCGQVRLMQTCAPHEKAFSILRINVRILQSFSVVFFVAPPITEIG